MTATTWLKMAAVAVSYFLVECYAYVMLQPGDLMGLAFGGAWALLLSAVVLCLPKMVGRVTYGVSYYLIAGWTIGQTGYYQTFGKIMWLTDLFYLDEGAVFLGDVLSGFSATWWIGAAVLLGTLCVRFRVMELLLSPLLSAVRATPVTSFIVLALVWLSSPRVPILTGFLMTLPVVYSALVQAIRAIDPKLIEMAQMYGFSRAKTLVHVVIPAILPAFIESCLASIGLCWKAVVAAEVIGVPKLAVGSKLYEAKIYLETDSLLAWTLTVVLLSVLLEALLKKAARRLMEVRHG